MVFLVYIPQCCGILRISPSLSAWDGVVYDHICWQNNLATIYGTGTVNTKTSVGWTSEEVFSILWKTKWQKFCYFEMAKFFPFQMAKIFPISNGKKYFFISIYLPLLLTKMIFFLDLNVYLLFMNQTEHLFLTFM